MNVSMFIEYTTPGGSKYGIGTKFKYSFNKYIYTITNIAGSISFMDTADYTTSKAMFEGQVDNNTITIIQETVNNNQMKEVIEVGDIVKGSIDKRLRVVKSISGVGHVYYDDMEGYDYIQSLTLVTKAVKQKVIEIGDIVNGSVLINKVVASIDSAGKIVTTEGQFIESRNVKLVSKAVKIEVGDLVEYIPGTNLVGQQRIVESVNDTHVWFNKEKGSWDKPKNLKVVTKANKQEIIGYELLKDLPGISAGTKSNEYNGRKAFFTNYTAQYPDLNDTTWFKPIYKAKDVIVKISGEREIIIKDNKVTLRNNTISFHDITKVNNLLNPPVMVANQFSVGIKVISIGCQEFTKQDIEAVYKKIVELNK